jgi:NADPH:quinone reductase
VEYATYPALTTFHIPDSLSFEEAATIPLGITIAAMGIFRRLSYDLDSMAAETKDHCCVLQEVWVVSPCNSPRLSDWGLLQSQVPVAPSPVQMSWWIIGKVNNQILEALKGEKLHYAFDTVSENGTTKQLASLIEPGMKVATIVIVLYPGLNDDLPEFIQYLRMSVFSCNGEEQKFGPQTLPASPKDKEFVGHFFPMLEQWLKEGKITPNKISVVPGGLAGVLEGFRRMRDEEVGWEKLVFRIAETPGL